MALVGGLVLGLVPLVLVPAHADTTDIAPDQVLTPAWIGEEVVINPLQNLVDPNGGTLSLVGEPVQLSADTMVSSEGDTVTVQVVGWNTPVAQIQYTVTDGSVTDTGIISYSVQIPKKPRLKKLTHGQYNLKVTNRTAAKIIFRWRNLSSVGVVSDGKVAIKKGAKPVKLLVTDRTITWNMAVVVNHKRLWLLSGTFAGIQLKR